MWGENIYERKDRNVMKCVCLSVPASYRYLTLLKCLLPVHLFKKHIHHPKDFQSRVQEAEPSKKENKTERKETHEFLNKNETYPDILTSSCTLHHPSYVFPLLIRTLD